jgi:hypothetical protein
MLVQTFQLLVKVSESKIPALKEAEFIFVLLQTVLPVRLK